MSLNVPRCNTAVNRKVEMGIEVNHTVKPCAILQLHPTLHGDGNEKEVEANNRNSSYVIYVPDVTAYRNNPYGGWMLNKIAKLK